MAASRAGHPERPQRRHAYRQAVVRHDGYPIPGSAGRRGLIEEDIVETLKLITSYLKIINPFMAAILSALNAYDARDKAVKSGIGNRVSRGA